MEAFKSLMKMMEESTGPLHGDQIATLKKQVMEDPAVLSMVLPGPNVELCSLLHHAAAGRVRDRHLLEWLIQMGALYRQPSHFHNPPEIGQNRRVGLHNDQLCDYMAVHSAAKAGYPDMVRLILGANHFRDTNKVTYQTKDSLPHIAVRNSDRGVLAFVMHMGANVTHKNAAGKYVHDLTTNPRWKRELLTSVVEQRKHDELIQEFKRERAQGMQIQQDRVEQGEKLKERLEQHRDAAAQGLDGSAAVATANMKKKPAASTTNAASSAAISSTAASAEVGGSSKKKNKKKKKKDEDTIRADDHVTETALQLMEQLSVSKKGSTTTAATGETTNAVDRVDRLAELLEALKEGGRASPAEGESTAAAALNIIDEIKSKVMYLAQSSNLQDFSRDMVLRDANDASRVLFLLSTYHRQLPPAPTAAREDLWQVESPMPLPTTALGKVQQRAGPDLDFTDFLSFLALTATLYAEYRRTAQAKELLDLLERRLLKVRQRVLLFRKFVETLVEGRANAGLTQPLGATDEATRQLAWYVSDHGIPNAEVVSALDMMFGCRFYRRIGPLTDDMTSSFAAFTEQIVEDADDADAVAVYVDKHVVLAAYSLDRVDAAARIVAVAARECGVRLPAAALAAATTEPTLSLRGFEFSAAGIIRK